MNNRLFSILSLILVGILVGTSYLPQAARAEELFQEGEPYHEDIFDEALPEYEEADELDTEWDLLDQELDEKKPWHPVSSYSIPGLTLVPSEKGLTYSNWLDGCLASYYDGPLTKSFVYPITIPNQSRFFAVRASYKNDTAHNQDGYELFVFRSFREVPSDGSDGTDYIFSKPLTKKTEGMHSEVWALDRVVDNDKYVYWIEFYFPKGRSQTSICTIKIAYYSALP